MPDHDLRSAIDALCARLQSELHTQVAELTSRHAEEREVVRRDSDAQWAAKLDAVREEWQGRLQAGLADAAADADKRHAAEAERARLEVEGLAKSAAEAADRHRQEIETVRAEWQGRLQAGVADAAADAERRLIAETDRIRQEVEQAAAESIERVRGEMTSAAGQSTADLRAELEQSAAHAATRLREEMQQSAAHATTGLREEMDRALATERERAGAEIETERARIQTLLAAERDRSTTDLAAERLKTRALEAALEEAQVALSQERAAASLQAAQPSHDAPAIVEARVAERQAQLELVERLLGAVRSIDGSRSLSETLTSLTHAAGTVAPRAALFIVNGQALQGWKAAGFDDSSPATLRLAEDDLAGRGLLTSAVMSGRAVSTTDEAAPSFAKLPSNRAGLAVPITVGGHSVAVLYADAGSAAEPEAPASWPEAVQVLAAHASACLAQITAVRTTQAIHQMSAPSGTRPVAGAGAPGSPSGSEEDGSARRYARLLVSEIKLYNEAAVRTGREKRDLLHRLAAEIDRARRLYLERVSPTVGARASYFQQELVHTLADGDAALLGEVV